MAPVHDATVVGSGPNGLAAAVTLAEAGLSVQVLEMAERPGGGLRTEELLEPGFRHDICSTVMALAPISPFLSRFSLDLVRSPAPLAHPLDDGTAVMLERSVDRTAWGLGRDGAAYRRLVEPLAAAATHLAGEVLRPPLHRPRHPVAMARFGPPALLPAARLARWAFRDPRARALFAGVSGHSMLPLDRPLGSAFGLVMLVAAHAGGWPVARGGSATVADTLVRRLRELGGEVQCGHPVRSVEELDGSRAVLLDLVPKGVLEVAGHRLPERYRRKLERYRMGAGVFKLDWTLEEPIPWTAAECARAATVHLGGTLEEIADSECHVSQGRHPDRPFVILVQPTLFDAERAPAGCHVAWAYCHVPNGSTTDMSEAVEKQIERFAPGFRELVRSRSVWSPARLERSEPNCVGGDIGGGLMDFRQALARPVLKAVPYATPDPSLFICSAATPPGGAVHGMCGVNAAQVALRRRFGR